jgi:hypothetical protein
MKTFLISLLMGVLCVGVAGCESNNDDSPATVTTVTTNAATGVVQTNVVAVEDVAAEVAGAPAADAEEALGAPLAANTVTGKWLGGYSGDGINALLSLSLVQDGETVTGTFSFSDAGSGTIDGSQWISGNRLNLSVKRNGIICLLECLVDYDAATITGEWADKAGNEGSFSLR